MSNRCSQTYVPKFVVNFELRQLSEPLKKNLLS
jgi:hypothetical protein